MRSSFGLSNRITARSETPSTDMRRVARPHDCSYNDHMKGGKKTVGSRELKTRLGQYLQEVRGGETILVTDRGKPVAELRPIEAADDPAEEALRRMEAEGLITRPTRRGGLMPFKPIRLPRGMSASEAVSTDRDERG